MQFEVQLSLSLSRMAMICLRYAVILSKSIWRPWTTRRSPKGENNCQKAKNPLVKFELNEDRTANALYGRVNDDYLLRLGQICLEMNKRTTKRLM